MPGERIHTVRFEPVGIEMDVAEGETILDAAFRQGVAVMHGCKEGQCSSCKSLLIDGDVEMLKYSTFALPDYERETDHILLCRSLAYSDVTIELLNYDEELLSRSIAVREVGGTLGGLSSLTHDIRLMEIELDSPMKFWAGQYVDLTIASAGITRSYSMASTPGDTNTFQFIIKKYPDGAFSALLDGGLKIGAALTVRGPFGSCFRREEPMGPMILVGGGSGMSPLWSILNDEAQSGRQRPVRFFYGARARRDLFYLDEIEALGRQLPDFRFVAALSHAEAGDAWDGESGLIHEVCARALAAEGLDGDMDAYACGAPPMIDAVIPVLQRAGVEPGRIYFDKFTPAIG